MSADIEVTQQFVRTFPQAARKAGYRVERARELVVRGFVSATSDPQVFSVRSESNPLGSYRVDLGEKTCTCPDAGKGNACKHRIAAWMHQQMHKHLDEQAQAIRQGLDIEQAEEAAARSSAAAEVRRAASAQNGMDGVYGPEYLARLREAEDQRISLFEQFAALAEACKLHPEARTPENKKKVLDLLDAINEADERLSALLKR
jgi:hypothetical protein